MFKEITQDQVQSFFEKGYMLIKGCVDRELARSWTDEAYSRLGYDKNDPSTWSEPLVWMNRHNIKPVKEISMRAWNAICDVVGGGRSARNAGNGDRVATFHQHQHF